VDNCVPCETGSHASHGAPNGSPPIGFDPSRGRLRSFVNVLDNLQSHETEDMRWLRIAGERLREIEEAEAPLRNKIPGGML
jgi:hypothetical protein